MPLMPGAADPDQVRAFQRDPVRRHRRRRLASISARRPAPAAASSTIRATTSSARWVGGLAPRRRSSRPA